MAETGGVVPCENREKKACKFGRKCRRKKCKYEHPPPVVENGAVDNAVEHDPPVQDHSHAVDPPAPHANIYDEVDQVPKAKKKAKKKCKFGNRCYRQNCPFLHHTMEDDQNSTPMPASTNESSSPAKTVENIRHEKDSQSSEPASPVTAKSEVLETTVDTSVDEATSNAPAAHQEAKSKAKKKKSKGKCFKGSKCRRPNCPFRHPQDSKPATDEDDQEPHGVEEQSIPEMVDVATLEASLVPEEPTEIPLAADLEDSLVNQAQQQKQQHSPASKPKRRGKREKESHRKQEEQDLLIRQEEERLQEELFEEVQEEQRRLSADEEEQRRLSADQARIEIDLIRQGIVAEKEEVKRQVPEFADPARVRAEREALERFKRMKEDQRKSEEAAKRFEEEERKRLRQQEELVRREREAEAERRRLAQEKESELRRSQDLAKEEARRSEQATKAQESQCQDETDEERERYKAERKAAKKERRRLEREAKAQPAAQERVPEASPKSEQKRNVSFSPSPAGSTGSNRENVCRENVEASVVEDEEAKKRRWQEELRRQKERAAEKKEEKQKRRRERMLEDREREAQERSKFWEAEIADEKQSVELIVQLCIAEFCRKNPNVNSQTLRDDANAMAKLEEAAQETYRSICKADIHSRVVVKGMKQQDLNGRNGTIQSWDESKEKFYVGLDTKKGKNTQYLYLLPENLEALPLSGSRKKGKKKADPVHMVFITPLFVDTELMFDVYKTDLDGMKQAESVGVYLEKLMDERDREEREAKELEEEELRREEEARHRRAQQRHRENMEWERRQREYEEQKAEYQEWRRQEREAKRAAADARTSGERDSFYEREHSGRCHCPRCEFENMFFGGFMGGRGGGGPNIFFSFGGGPGGGPEFFFSFGDDDEDQWDRRWEEMHEEELEEKNAEAAETLGVEVDATEAEIKRVFRKKARKYHPDSYRAGNHEDGMTKEEAEEHFKDLSNAYDHLMSNFDDSEEEYDDYE